VSFLVHESALAGLCHSYHLFIPLILFVVDPETPNADLVPAPATAPVNIKRGSLHPFNALHTTYLSFLKKAKAALALELECVGSVGNEATAAAGIYLAFLSFMNSVS
jgi:hypothetical protein